MDNPFKKKEAELPESLRGKTPEQIAAALDASAAATAKAAELEQKLQAEQSKSGTLQSEFDKVKQRLDAAEARTTVATTTTETGANKIPSVLDDEEAAFAARTAPLANATMFNAVQTAKLLARQKLMAQPDYAPVLLKYEAEVETLWNQVPMQSRMFEAAFENCFKIVLANHFKDIQDMKAKAAGELLVEGAGGPPRKEGEAEKDKLSDEELRIAKAMKISPEDYLKQKKGMNYVAA